MPLQLTSDEAFRLADQFRNLSKAVGDYRIRSWDGLSTEQRRTLEDAEWSLLNASSDMNTFAIGLVLEESQCSFDQLTQITAKGKETLETLADIRKAINIATAAVGLAAAIISASTIGDVGAVAKGAIALSEAISG
jgi:hypothetical protein